MIVISDSSPINYLVLIGHAEVLLSLFGRVVIPGAVFAELQRPGTPEVVRLWLASAPNWLEVRSATHAVLAPKLGAGETEAMNLAEELHADLLLIDDKLARSVAEARGLTVTGTVNVLQAAAARDLLDLAEAIASLRKTTFHIAEEILQHALDADGRGSSTGLMTEASTSADRSPGFPRSSAIRPHARIVTRASEGAR